MRRVTSKSENFLRSDPDTRRGALRRVSHAFRRFNKHFGNIFEAREISLSHFYSLEWLRGKNTSKIARCPKLDAYRSPPTSANVRHLPKVLQVFGIRFWTVGKQLQCSRSSSTEYFLQGTPASEIFQQKITSYRKPENGPVNDFRGPRGPRGLSPFFQSFEIRL
jgi:hypothetical protein